MAVVDSIWFLNVFLLADSFQWRALKHVISTLHGRQLVQETVVLMFSCNCGRSSNNPIHKFHNNVSRLYRNISDQRLSRDFVDLGLVRAGYSSKSPQDWTKWALTMVSEPSPFFFFFSIFFPLPFCSDFDSIAAMYQLDLTGLVFQVFAS